MPIASSRACEWCMGSTWCHLSGFYGLEELTNLRYIHIIYNLNCPESQLFARLLLIWGRRGFVAVRMRNLPLDCGRSVRPVRCCASVAAAVSRHSPLYLVNSPRR